MWVVCSTLRYSWSIEFPYTTKHGQTNEFFSNQRIFLKKKNNKKLITSRKWIRFWPFILKTITVGRGIRPSNKWIIPKCIIKGKIEHFFIDQIKWIYISLWEFSSWFNLSICELEFSVISKVLVGLYHDPVFQILVISLSSVLFDLLSSIVSRVLNNSLGYGGRIYKREQCLFTIVVCFHINSLNIFPKS